MGSTCQRIRLSHSRHGLCRAEHAVQRLSTSKQRSSTPSSCEMLQMQQMQRMQIVLQRELLEMLGQSY